jgi:hypothetical protein
MTDLGFGPRLLSRFATLAFALLLAACPSPRHEPPPDVGGGDAAAGDGPRAPDGPAPGDGPQATADAFSDPECGAGRHKCNGVCVDSASPLTCGTACEPCPTPIGGSASCDGIRCNVVCPSGQKPCLDKCVASDAICGGCPPGQNPCNGLCVDAKNVASCGSACAPCPTSPNGVTSCDGDKCNLTCGAGFHRCGDACVSDADVRTCGSSCSPCAAPTGGEATCEAGACGTRCPTGTRLCLGRCIGMNEPCEGTMCPAGRHACNNNCVPDDDVNACGPGCQACSPQANADVRCNGTTCVYTCRSGFHDCNGVCKDSRSVLSCGTSCGPCPQPAGAVATCRVGSCDFDCPGAHKCNGGCQACCGAADCTGATGGKVASCNGGSCSYACPSGQKDCNGTCRQCCNDGDCGSGRRCDGGTCENCPAEICTNATDDDCDGRIDCADSDCSNKTCAGNKVCNGGTCTVCGGNGDLCCAGTPCQTPLECASGRCRPPCGDSGEPCCANHQCNGNAVACDYDESVSDPAIKVGRCVSCGDHHNPCCPGDVCNKRNDLGCIRWSTNTNPYCETCGHEYDVCCPPGSGHPTCDGGFTCKVDRNSLPNMPEKKCLPSPCGLLNQRCCAGLDEAECSQGTCDFSGALPFCR